MTANYLIIDKSYLTNIMGYVGFEYSLRYNLYYNFEDCYKQFKNFYNKNNNIGIFETKSILIKELQEIFLELVKDHTDDCTSRFVFE